MPSPTNLGLVIGGPYATLAPLAQQVEARGFDSVWVAEATQDSIVQATVVAGATSTIQVGTNITLAFPRSPTVTAMAAWDLNEITGDRFVVGLGSQVRRIVEERFSAQFDRPAHRMAEYLQAMRAVWEMERGNDVTFAGELYQVTRPALTGLGRAAGRTLPRAYVAAVGPRMTQAATSYADGMLGHPFVSVDYLQQSILPRIDAGLAAASRERSSFSLAQGVIVSIAEDRDVAYREAKQQIAFYGSTPNYAPVFAASGDEALQAELNTVFKRSNRDADAMVAAVPDAAVERYAIAGTADEVRDRVAEFEGLADTLVLSTAWFKVPAARMAENLFAVMETFGRSG